MTPLAVFQQFVNDAQAAAYYSKWASQNSGELSRWETFRNAVLAGQHPAAPSMTTRYGAALVDAGLIALAGGFTVTISGPVQVGAKLAARVA